MSPEQTKNDKYSGKTDMYALGIILFEMLYAPFSSEMERIVKISKLRENPPQLPKDFHEKIGPNSKEFTKLILSLLQEDPRKRPSSKELFEKYQDSLYQDMIVKDVREYKKIIKFLFSKNNMFDFENLDNNHNFENLPGAVGNRISFDCSRNFEMNLEMANRSKIRDFILQKMHVCFKIHTAFRLNLEGIIPGNDIRFYTRFTTDQKKNSQKFKNLLFTRKELKLPKDKLGELYLDDKGSLLMNCGRNMMIPWVRYVSNGDFGSLRTWIVAEHKRNVGKMRHFQK